MDYSNDSFMRVISTQVRFGCGYRTVDGKKQFFAWHGVPSRNDDFFTTALISESEFEKICKGSIHVRLLLTEIRPRSFAKNTWMVMR